MRIRSIVNPARAGMIPSEWVRHDAGRGKPRASGDDPAEETEEGLLLE